MNSSIAATIVVDPDPVDLGEIAAGEIGSTRFTLSNPSDRAIAITRIVSGCDCLAVEPTSLLLQPCERARIAVTFDPAADPEYRGGLAVDMTGHGPDDRVVFRTAVHLRVTSVPEGPGGAR